MDFCSHTIKKCREMFMAVADLDITELTLFQLPSFSGDLESNLCNVRSRKSLSSISFLCFQRGVNCFSLLQ